MPSEHHDSKIMLESEKGIMVTTFTKSESVAVFQVAICFSEKAAHSKSLEKALANFQFSEVDYETVESEWTMQTHESGFKYLFLESAEWNINKTPVPSFEGRGDMVIQYKTYKELATQDEYLLRYNNHLPGVTYTDEFDALDINLQFFADHFKSEVKNFEYFKSLDVYNGIRATAIDSEGIHYYFQIMVRGSVLYVLLQKSVAKKRNDEFFTSFELTELILSNAEMVEFTHEDSYLTMLATDQVYEYDTDDITENWDFAYESIATVLEIELEPIDRYTTLDPIDSLFATFDNNILASGLADTILGFRTWDHNPDFPLRGVQFMSDSSSLVQTELMGYGNDYIYYFIFSSPYETYEKGQIDHLINSIQIKKNPNLEVTSFDSKLPYILSDLESIDTSIFNPAREALLEYEVISDDDKAPLLAALNKKMKDDNDDFNAKYDIITLLHSFEDDMTEKAMIDHFSQTDNLPNKERIVESFSMRSEPQSFERLIAMIEAEGANLYLSNQVYNSVEDSIELFAMHYDRMKALADKKVAYLQFMDLNVSLIDSTYAAPVIDKEWVSRSIEAELREYITYWSQDSAVYTEEHVMRYLLNHQDDPELLTQFYDAIKISDDDYG